METVFFSGVLGPGTEQRIELIERTFTPNPAPLRIDMSRQQRWSDPTLTIFHQPKADKADEQPRKERE